MLVQIEISRVGLEAQGVGYDAEGNIYFVPDVLPGDVVRVECEPTTKKYRDASLVEIIRSSPDRRDSLCPYFSDCGGCDWLNWDYDAQLKAKTSSVVHVLERAQWAPRELLPILGARSPLAYRNRIQVRQEGAKVGFYRRRSHDIVDIESCATAHPEVNAELARLRGEAAALGRHKIEIALDDDGRVHRFQDAPHAVAGFRQIHAEQNERLKEVVRGALGRIPARRVLELFCGDGNLTWDYQATVEEVIAVDSSSAALDRARSRGASRPGLTWCHAAVTPSLLRRMPGEFRDHYDTLLVDPPRQGVGVSLTDFVQPHLKGIVYVSCSPLSFSKDLTGLKKEGFVLDTLQPIDMFPQTRHLELVALFLRP